MRFIVVAAIGLCGCTATDGTPIIYDGSVTGLANEIASPGSTYKAREAADDTRCRHYGFKPGTEGYGNCRLQIDQIRATKSASVTPRNNSAQKLSLLCTEALSRGDGGAAQVHC